MSQNSYSLNMASAFAGMKANAQYDLVESYIALRTIQFGRGLGSYSGDVEKIHPAVNDQGVLLYDGPFVTGNIITITVNGVATSPVTFATSATATANAVKAAIEALDAEYVVTVANPTTTVSLTIKKQGVLITLGSSITGGTPPNLTSTTYSSNDIFRGVSLHTHVAEGVYAVNDAVNTLRKGVVWVETADAVVKDAVAYVSLSDGSGKFTDLSTNNLATGGTFKSATSGAGLAMVEINLP